MLCAVAFVVAIVFTSGRTSASTTLPESDRSAAATTSTAGGRRDRGCSHRHARDRHKLFGRSLQDCLRDRLRTRCGRWAGTTSEGCPGGFGYQSFALARATSAGRRGRGTSRATGRFYGDHVDSGVEARRIQRAPLAAGGLATHRRDSHQRNFCRARCAESFATSRDGDIFPRREDVIVCRYLEPREAGAGVLRGGGSWRSESSGLRNHGEFVRTG